MSASQARLLSITSRLTNNEFRAQTITNSKLRLAEKSEEASAEYMDALNSQQLVFGVYSDNGEYSTQKLTPALIYDYAPLKNQYALVNPAGKMLVSNVDAKNFENSNTLYDFLECYDLVADVDLLNDYNVDMDKYNIEKAKYDIDKAKYDADLKVYQEQLDAYLESLNQKDLYTPFSGIVGTSDAPKSCYSAAKNGGYSCFTHLLDYLINYTVADGRRQQDLTTSTGQVFTTANNGGATLDGESAENKAIFEEISGNLSKVKCDGCDNDDYKTNSTGKFNLLEDKKQKGETITEFDRLKSDYIETANGYEVKTLEQKAIDMYYIIQFKDTFVDDEGNSLITKDVMNELLDNFTDGDMQKLKVDPPGDIPVEPVLPNKPVKPEFNISLNDKDKAQWYTNLWYSMNGSDTANKVQTTTLVYNNKEETIHTVDDIEKSGKGGTYEVFEDMNLFKSDDWLQFALEHGMVSMVQAQYTNPSADSGKFPELTSEGITWKSIIYTNASDIKSQEDEVAIALAEVKYKNAITEIENKDKKFDQDLKKLDTEHTAIQTEYDSIKEVISKNIDRSFKAFS